MVRDCVVCVVRCVGPTEMVRDMRGKSTQRVGKVCFAGRQGAFRA